MLLSGGSFTESISFYVLCNFQNIYEEDRLLYRHSVFLTEKTEMEFKEFEPRFKSAKTRFKLSAGINLETFDTILSGTNHI